MFNMNSPIVQKMLRETPPPMGNFQYGYGNTPTLETVYTRSPDPVSASDPNQVVRTTEAPFPSPKEMVMNAGMQQQLINPMMSMPAPMPGMIPMATGIYGQMGGAYPYAPQPYVPGGTMIGGVPNILQGYSNPYMGYGSYMGLPQQRVNSEYRMPADWEVPYLTYEQLMIRQAGMLSGLSYDGQLECIKDVMHTMCASVSAYLGEDKETASKRASYFDIQYRGGGDGKPKSVNEMMEEREKNARWNQPDANIVVKIMSGDEVICSNTAHEAHLQHMKDPSSRMWEGTMIDFGAMVQRWNYALANWEKWRNECYANAIERKYDHCEGGLPGFFNTGMVAISNQMWREENQRRLNYFAVRGQYSSEDYMRRLMQESISERQMRYINRFGTRKTGMLKDPEIDYKTGLPKGLEIDPATGMVRGSNEGMLPNGQMVQPGTDPRVASSFYMDPNTGEFTIKAPEFKKDRSMDAIAMARERFMQQIYHPTKRGRMY